MKKLINADTTLKSQNAASAQLIATKKINGRK
jgi:hypothetical protein